MDPSKQSGVVVASGLGLISGTGLGGGSMVSSVFMPLKSSSNKFRMCCWSVAAARGSASPEEGGGGNEGVGEKSRGEARFWRMMEVLRKALEAWLLLSIPLCLSSPLLWREGWSLSRLAMVVVGSGENRGDCQEDWCPWGDLSAESKPRCKTLLVGDQLKLPNSVDKSSKTA